MYTQEVHTTYHVIIIVRCRKDYEVYCPCSATNVQFLTMGIISHVDVKGSAC